MNTQDISHPKSGTSAVIIGAGIGGLATACYLAKMGVKVTVVEKNEQLGGRASLINVNVPGAGGFVFDKGPSWYMMPDIFEHFFELMGEKITDYMNLKLLSPSYRVFMKSQRQTAEGKDIGAAAYDFYADLEKNCATFESLEPGSSEVLKAYLERTKFQYEIAKHEFMFKNYDSIFDFFNKRVMTEGRKLPLFKKVKDIVEKDFKNETLRKVMQYQTVLLGTAPGDTPGIYSLMNYVDFGLGVWYPDGGIYKIVESMVMIAQKHGVQFVTNSPATNIIVENKDGEQVATGIEYLDSKTHQTETIKADYVISNADMEFTERALLAPEYREKTPAYWNKRTLAPSAFILYLGVKGTIDSFSHHNLIFSEKWDKNFSQIFKKPEWPEDPSMYICAPSKSDASVAPEGYENLFVLVPIAAGLTYTKDELVAYRNKTIQTIAKECNIPDFESRIVYEQMYAVEDFVKDYNAFKGTALGLAHTLGQTAIWRPNNISKKVRGLLYVGAGTNPGIGMPICIISAELAVKRIIGNTDFSPLSTLDQK
jgi:phytoene desaturase